jgi:hypothetical protein
LIAAIAGGFCTTARFIIPRLAGCDAILDSTLRDFFFTCGFDFDNRDNRKASVSEHAWGDVRDLAMSLYRYPGVGAEDGSVARDNAVLSIGGKSSLCLVGSLLASSFFFFDDVSSLFNKRSREMDGAQ